MKGLLFALAIPVILSTSCANGARKSEEQKSDSGAAIAPSYDATLSAGKVMDSVACKNDNSQYYTLYLPSGYTSGKAYPVIYFFDAHARGALPVRMYKDIAEQYGVVLISSDLSKNGTDWQMTQTIASSMMADSKARINIDPKRVYICGFSGGARIAGMLGAQEGGVAGVIGCSAGFMQNGQVNGKFNYFGLVGNADFNEPEMQAQDGMLQQNGFTHQLLVFEGIHQWPSAINFQTAVLWLLVNEMKTRQQPKNDSWVQALKSNMDKNIADAMKAQDWINAYNLVDGTGRILDGLVDAASYKKQEDALVAGDKLKNAVNEQQQLQQAEMNGQQGMAKDFASHDPQWWAGQIAKLKQLTKSAGSKPERDMNARLLAYLGMVSYMNVNHALTTGDLTNADKYLQVFKTADPKNPDVAYLRAIFCVKKDDQQGAVAALNDALKLGYNDAGQLKTEAAFSGLQGNAGFQGIIKKANENMR